MSKEQTIQESSNGIDNLLIAVPLKEWQLLNNNIVKLSNAVEHLREQTTPSDFVTPNEAIEILKIGRTTWQRYITEGKIKLYNVAGRKRKLAKRSELLEILGFEETPNE